MEELKDVILNVYSLTPAAAAASDETSRTGNFLTRLLPAMGMGAYHTEIVLDGYHYTFAAQAGIVKTSAANRGRPQYDGASFQQAIPLGSCGRLSRGEINTVLQRLGDQFFTPTAYHLVHRNCNHFTETLATALILYDDLIEHMDKAKRLATYPDWVNRLASTGGRLVSHDHDIVPCNVWQEAVKAVGADEKFDWNMQRSSSSNKKESKTKKAASNQKKELSDKQKAILEKIRKK